MVDLFIARHGETEENVAQVLQGHMPGHLTEAGQAQAVALREELVRLKVKPDVLVVSDLQRAIDTACIVNAAFRLPITTTPLLRERDWGSMTGMSLKNRRVTEFPADVESVEKMFVRARQFLRAICSQHEGRVVLAIGHGLFNRVIQAALRHATIADVPRMQNAEVRRLSVDLGTLADSADAGIGVDTVSAN